MSPNFKITDITCFTSFRYILFSSSLKEFELEYISEICCCVSISIDGFYVKNRSFQCLLSMAQKEQKIVVKGPKGVGKSSSLLGMLANCSVRGKPAIMLTQDSFKCPSSTYTYLKEIAKQLHLPLSKNAYLYLSVIWCCHGTQLGVFE